MRTKLTITIPEPCHENWNLMTTVEKGRHCASCNKTVHDFTRFSDDKIIKTIKSSGPVCGRFTTAQLDRELSPSAKNKSSYLTTISSLLITLFSLSSIEAVAQGRPSVIHVDSMEKNKKEKELPLVKSQQKLITGTIVSKEDNLPLPGVTIVNKRTKQETQSDFDGIYKLHCKSGDEVEFTFIGLETQRLLVTKDSIYDIAMKEDVCQYDSYIVAGYADYRWSRSYYRKCRQKQRKAARIEKVKKIKNGEIKRSFVGRILYTLSYPFRSRD